MGESLKERLERHVAELERAPGSSEKMIQALREALDIAEPISEEE